jgi:uncharacterized protein
MTKKLRQTTFSLLGGIFFMLGIIGIIIPILPTTPFMIVSAAFFAESSPRLHNMLLNNPWFGEDLRCWECNKTMKRHTKKRATIIIIISFSLSIAILWGSIAWQILLLFIALTLLFFLWRIEETYQATL